MQDNLADRILEIKKMRVGDIEANTLNPYKRDEEQQAELGAIAREFGKMGVLIAYHSERNEGRLTLFDGHQRQTLDPDESWHVGITDLTDEEVDRLSLMFDEVGGRGSLDMGNVKSLLGDALEHYEGLGDIDSPILGILDDYNELFPDLRPQETSLDSGILSPNLDGDIGGEEPKETPKEPSKKKSPDELVKIDLYFDPLSYDEFTSYIDDAGLLLGMTKTEDVILGCIKGFVTSANNS